MVTLSVLAAVAAFVLGVTGFGFAIVAMAFFPLVIGLKSASVLVSFAGLPIAFYLLVPLFRRVEWKTLLRIMAGVVIGTPVGIWGLVRVEERWLTLALGIFLVLYLASDMLTRNRNRPALPPWAGYAAGFLGGAIGGAFNTSGPPVAAYVSSLRMDKHAVKATILAYLALGSVYKVVFLVWRGMITTELLVDGAVLLVPTFLGMFAGTFVFNRVSSEVFKWVIQALLLATAVFMIVTGVRG